MILKKQVMDEKMDNLTNMPVKDHGMGIKPQQNTSIANSSISTNSSIKQPQKEVDDLDDLLMKTAQTN